MFENTPLSGTDVTVLGGGFGGLSAAAYLADAGADVTVLEQNERLGGAANLIESEGFRFDTGPSWYLMPDVFERFFDHFDRDPEDYYTIEPLDPHYRVFYTEADPQPEKGSPYADDLETQPGCDWVTTTPDVSQSREIFAAYEAGGGETFDEYLAEAEYSYEVGMENFVYKDRSRLRDMIDLDVAKSGRGLSLLGSMQDHVESYFDEPKLQQLLQYTLVFLGGSPHNTPALYNLMAHVDYNLGVYYPEGGIYSVVEGLADLGAELGVDYETGVEVTDIQNTTTGLALQTSGGRRRTDTLVSNANPAHVERELLSPGSRDHGPEHWEGKTYAPSSIMFYLGVEGDVGPLAHHSLVFPPDWDPHFERIFDDPAWPEDPAYYLSVPSKTDDTVAPDGHHAVVILVPIAPGLDDDAETRERYREKVLTHLAEEVGVDLRDRIVFDRSVCVSDYRQQYNYPQGTALGLAHTLRQTGPLRPSHRASNVDGLYYVGSYTNPGIGVPMTLISGQHVAEAVVEDRTGSGSPLDQLKARF
ncbi:Phytoene dehydrogenase or related enzyme [Halapricum desulfuricans]|uniref:Phytoene dehydrogenase or related enzyme n=1 Tax=Halapricum desulfuricans TaxID=2841257 RepID=A0A897NKJ4_9EURY|nr:phytoene desaturase family protein [Halapricum desulfuricans]QSG13262.1 Phytoene dehydrogenase or related enzyme [Halapricum desulfuricans]